MSEYTPQSVAVKLTDQDELEQKLDNPTNVRLFGRNKDYLVENVVSYAIISSQESIDQKIAVKDHSCKKAESRRSKRLQSKKAHNIIDGVCNNNNAIVSPEIDNKKRRKVQELKENLQQKVKKSVKNKHQQYPDENLKELHQQLIKATEALAHLHPQVVDRNEKRRGEMLQSCGYRSCLTDAVVSTMLSQNTTDKNSKSAFRSLKSVFPTWDSVLKQTQVGDDDKLADAIRVAGLAKTRAERIRALLRTIQQERGTTSLDYLREMSSDDVKRELGRFKGLGPKTISCVLLFALGRAEFPVDTHVLRISKQHSWLPSSINSREAAYDYLNQVVPDQIKMDLHCLLVTHGKYCHKCAANGKPQFPPSDGTKLKCPLQKMVLANSTFVEKDALPIVVKSIESSNLLEIVKS